MVSIHFRTMMLWSHAWLRVPILFNLSKWLSPFIVPMIAAVWKFLPRWGISSLTLGHENILFHYEHPIELGQEDRVMKRNTSRVMEHNSSLQGAMSPTNEWKSCLRDWEVFSLPTVIIYLFLHDQCIIHHFLCSPSFHKSQDEILF
jgi:hypothetical protein